MCVSCAVRPCFIRVDEMYGLVIIVVISMVVFIIESHSVDAR
jgi:hypothetical protein